MEAVEFAVELLRPVEFTAAEGAPAPAEMFIIVKRVGMSTVCSWEVA